MMNRVLYFYILSLLGERTGWWDGGGGSKADKSSKADGRFFAALTTSKDKPISGMIMFV